MKFNLLCVLTLCVCLGQMCSGREKTINETKQLIRDGIYAVGDQFVDDFVTIADQYRHNSFIQEFFAGTFSVLSELIPKDRNSKIDVNQVIDIFSKNKMKNPDERGAYGENLNILESILSKHFPPERYNGVLNVIFVCSYDVVPTEEIQSALNYLYGTDTEATKTSFIAAHNFPNLTNVNVCPKVNERISELPSLNVLNSLIGVKPKVIQDFLAIRQQFPCSRLAYRFSDQFVHIIHRLGGDKWRINACMIKDSPGNWDGNPYRLKRHMEEDLEGSESVLSTRLPDETIRGIINFKRATIPDTPIDEIEKALQYLYDDVPKSNCSTTENTTLQTELNDSLSLRS